MVIEWKEREHGEEDEMAMQNEACMNALRDCGLKKFFITPCLRPQPKLLYYLISIWDENEEVFKLRDQVLALKVSDVYFIIGLSRRGPVPIMIGSRPSGDKMDMLMARVCPGAQTGAGSGKLYIHTVCDLALWVVLHTITRVARSQAPHEATKAQLLLYFECMNPTLFDWATALTTNIKRQLTKCKKAKLK